MALRSTAAARRSPAGRPRTAGSLQGGRVTKPAVPPPAPRVAVGERVAAIDIGSNSIHMVIVEATPGDGYRVLDREREMVCLGESAFGRGHRLSARALRDGLAALRKMTTLARLKGAERIVAVATSAVREAANGNELLAHIRAETGVAPRLLSGGEEAQLIHRAVREAVDLGPGRAVVIDVGGGSTEWIAAVDDEIELAVSLPLGSLRCAGWLAGDPPGRRAIARLRRAIQARLADVPAPTAVTRLIATSGTAQCCADLAALWRPRRSQAYSGGLRELSPQDLDQVIARLAGMKRRRIARLAPVGGPRSTSILAGAVLLAELADHAGADRLLLCDRALREGVVLEALGGHAVGSRPPGELRRRQVLALARRAEAILPHGEQTARLAARLYDLTAPLHGLGASEREWLEHAALLHDIGHAIHYRAHHKHSYYLISTATLDGFDPREIEVIAHVARYHRGADPRPRHASFAALAAWQQETITTLAALLRVADALDRTHASRIAGLDARMGRRRIQLVVQAADAVDLELATARERAALFEEVLGRQVSFRQQAAAPAT